MTERSYRRLFWGLALLGALVDQGTKYGIFHWLYTDPGKAPAAEGIQVEVTKPVPGSTEEEIRSWYPVLPGCFQLEAHYKKLPGGELVPQVNQGALFGLGREHQALANVFFATISVLAAGAIIYWGGRRSTASDWSLCAALGLILAGTVGNLYDRVVFNGVRDFLHAYWDVVQKAGGQELKRVFDWPVFNFADCCLVVGAFLLLAQACWSRSPAREDTSTSATVGMKFVNGASESSNSIVERSVAGRG